MRLIKVWMLTETYHRTCFQVTTHKYFDYMMLVFIALSSLELCFQDSTVQGGSTKANVLYGLDIAFAVVFGTEVSTTPRGTKANHWVRPYIHVHGH